VEGVHAISAAPATKAMMRFFMKRESRASTLRFK
jgi:hypothetical protein